MHELELIFGLMVVVSIMATFARWIGIPYPIVLVIGGAALGFVPDLAHVELSPDTVFLLFLPPVLFSAAYNTDLRQFRANRRPITLLAVGLVLFTTGAVALVAHAVVPGMSWPAAFVLGAIVSPPDAVATTAIIQRLGVPRRIVTILEGESLVNDATALVTYRFAVAAVVSGSFSLADAAGRFLLVAIGGIAIGIVVGKLLVLVLARIDDPTVEISATLLAPIAAYLPAEELGVSGVLAAVTAGLILGEAAPVKMATATRVRGYAVWEVVIFLINGFAFILVGLQLPSIVEGLEGVALGDLNWYVAAIGLTTILVRLIWVFPATYLPRILLPRLRVSDPAPPWQAPMMIGWAGLRGVVSLAAALALPLETDAGAPFPFRNLIVFLTFCVILLTLVGQGLTLPPLIARLGLVDDGASDREYALARREGARAVIAYLDGLAGQKWVPSETAATMRGHYEHRLRHVPDSLDPADSDHDHLGAHDRLRQEIVNVERRTIVALRNSGQIGNEALRRAEYDLDLSELRSEE